MGMKFEERPYGPDSTPEEVSALEQSVSIHEPEVLRWEEIPVQSIFHLGIVGRRLHELSQPWAHYDLLIDLTAARPPSAKVRAALRRLFTDQPKLRRTVVFTEKNLMLSIAAKLVLTNSGLRNFAVYKTCGEALEDLRNVQRRAQ